MNPFYKHFTLGLMCICASNSIIIAQTGVENPFMKYSDTAVMNFINRYQIPGASIAITQNGKLIYARGFGYADLGSTEPVQPYHKFRIASLSKPITAVAIMKLVEQGQLALTDKVFGPNALLDNDPEIGNAQITDTRIFDITVQHLLEHTAGWDRDIDCFPNPTTPYTYKAGGCDPIVAPLHVAQLTNTSNPVTKPALMTFLLEKGLDHTPGVKHAYSNVAYLMLGKVIEKISGVTYKSYLQDSVLALMNICDMDIAKNYKSEKQIREVEYKGNGGGTYNIDGSNVVVPWEYGGLNIETMDAHGGWIASATDLVKFIVSIDRFTTKPDILKPATINQMVAPSTAHNNYAKGWSVNSNNNWWHTGALDGTASIFARTFNGFTWAVLLNKRIVDQTSSQFWGDLDALPWKCVSNITGTTNYDLMLEPTLPSQQLISTKISSNEIEIKWTKGNGN